MQNVMFSPENIKIFQKKVFDFYNEECRDLPWRKTTNPYKVLLSEFMLQQTQVSRVISYYNLWTNKWPSIKDLATESFDEVLKRWMGLGYNRRALYLHKTAQVIVNEYNENVLEAVKHYQRLPGVGKYTSHAVRIFAANEDIITVDTNIRRIFIHEFCLPESVTDNELYDLAQQALPKGQSRNWHNALMDYGSLHLTSFKTGIKPKTRQTRFEGSDRQFRGKILRLLLREPQDFSMLQKKFDLDKHRLEKILSTMISEEVISYNQKVYFIKNKG